MADFKRIRGRIEEVIHPNGVGAITAAEHQSLLLEMVDDINAKKADKEEVITVAESVSILSQEVESNRINFTESLDALEQKVDNLPQGGGDVKADGVYPDLTAGDLAGRGESVPAEFGFRASGGKSIKDGTAYVKEIQGNAVVWNQKVDKVYVDTDKVLPLRAGVSMIAGHKYLLMRTRTQSGCYCIVAQDFYQYFVGDNQHSIIFENQYDVISSGTYPSYPHIYCTGESGYVQLIDLTLMYGAGNEPTTIEEFNARKPIVEDEYAYNEGEVIAFNGESIKSVGDNAWDEEWEQGGIYSHGGFYDTTTSIRSKNFIKVLPNQEYYINRGSDTAGYIFAYDKDYQQISGWGLYGNKKTFVIPNNAEYVKFCTSAEYGGVYKNDIMIRLDHSGWKSDTGVGYEPYWADTLNLDSRIKAAFPQGMHKWDKVYNKDGKGYIVKGTGSVDLGDLEWELKEMFGHPVFISERNQLGGTWAQNAAICSLYVSDDYSLFNGADKTVAFNSGYYGSEGWSKDLVAISDSAYTDAASFKAAMAGVMLYYELAEPTIIEFDKPFKMDYKVADFGTEEVIPATDAEGNIIPSAPFKARTIYQFNAVDMIREHEIEITELQNVIAIMQAQLTSLINGGQ